jgi:hypothetical protein
MHSSSRGPRPHACRGAARRDPRRRALEPRRGGGRHPSPRLPDGRRHPDAGEPVHAACTPLGDGRAGRHPPPRRERILGRGRPRSGGRCAKREDKRCASAAQRRSFSAVSGSEAPSKAVATSRTSACHGVWVHPSRSDVRHRVRWFIATPPSIRARSRTIGTWRRRGGSRRSPRTPSRPFDCLTDAHFDCPGAALRSQSTFGVGTPWNKARLSPTRGGTDSRAPRLPGPGAGVKAERCAAASPRRHGGALSA